MSNAALVPSCRSRTQSSSQWEMWGSGKAAVNSIATHPFTYSLGRTGHPQSHKSEEQAHGINHTPQVLRLQHISLQGPSTSDSPHPCQRRQHIIVYLRVQGSNQGTLFHGNTNRSYNHHSILCLRHQTSSLQYQHGPSRRPLSPSRGVHVSEASREKRHHHHENRPVFQSNVSHVHS